MGERRTGMTKEQYERIAQRWHDEIRDHMGNDVYVYSGPDWWRDHLDLGIDGQVWVDRMVDIVMEEINGSR